MERLIKWLLIAAIVVIAGRWAVEHFIGFLNARYDEREEMARQVGERRAEQMRRDIEAGNAIHMDAMRRQLEQAQQSRSYDTLP